jgi:two-component system response regulator VicR
MTPIRKILIAEDELIIARVMKKVLERMDFEVCQVSDGPEAIQAAASFKPDLVILDIHLQNKSCGILAGKEIRKAGSTCPIVFTTGNSFEETKKEIEDVPDAHLFIKPVDTEELVKFIRTLNH